MYKHSIFMRGNCRSYFIGVGGSSYFAFLFFLFVDEQPKKIHRLFFGGRYSKEAKVKELSTKQKKDPIYAPFPVSTKIPRIIFFFPP